MKMILIAAISAFTLLGASAASAQQGENMMKPGQGQALQSESIQHARSAHRMHEHMKKHHHDYMMMKKKHHMMHRNHMGNHKMHHPM